MRFAPLTAALALAVTPLVVPQSAVAQDLDMEAVFRCSEETVARADCLAARETIVNNCTSCHTFVPIVMQSFDGDGWRGLLIRHVENGRVNQLSPETVEQLRLYLAENFNGSEPPPELPAGLLATWTSY